jgi:CheY-like chemotaxis protein
VVDDDPVVLLYLSELLRLQGCELRSFGDPQAALQALQDEAPDWLLTDQLMPGLTGSELARQALQRWPRLAVVLCTGYSDQLNEAAARALGVRHYLRKPFEPSQLLRLICNAAAPGAPGAAAPPTDPANPRTQAA